MFKSENSKKAVLHNGFFNIFVASWEGSGNLPSFNRLYTINSILSMGISHFAIYPDLQLFAGWVISRASMSSADLFRINCLKYISGNVSIRVSNVLDPDQARHFVGPDLGPNCLQR